MTPMVTIGLVLDAAIPTIYREVRGASKRISAQREALLEHCRKRLRKDADLQRMSHYFDAPAEHRWRVVLVVVDRIKHIVRGHLGVPAVTLAPRLIPTPSLLSA